MTYSDQEKKICKGLNTLASLLVIILLITVNSIQLVYLYFVHIYFLVFSSIELPGILTTSIGLLILFLLLYDYFSAALKSPGYTSDLNPTDVFPLCTICNSPKVYRAHHCSICNKCVLEMDHHCPWINNCIGLHNKMHFYRFIIWCILGSLFLAVLTAPTFWRISLEDKINPYPIDAVSRRVVLFVFPLGFSVTLVVGLLLGFQALLILKNETTIEYLAKRPRSAGYCRSLVKKISGFVYRKQENHIV